jgi:hypothetical protein
MQQRSIPWLWIALAAVLLLGPGRAGHLLIDLLGGLTLTLLLLPLLLGALGWIAWQVLRSRLQICPVCGISSLGGDVCPACGTPRSPGTPGQDAGSGLFSSPGTSAAAWEIDPRDVTIDVQATDLSQPSPPADPPGA